MIHMHFPFLGKLSIRGQQQTFKGPDEDDRGISSPHGKGFTPIKTVINCKRFRATDLECGNLPPQ
jgi:hypothetical protein